jgi:hypothetical protein
VSWDFLVVRGMGGKEGRTRRSDIISTGSRKARIHISVSVGRSARLVRGGWLLSAGSWISWERSWTGVDGMVLVKRSPQQNLCVVSYSESESEF